MSTTIKIVTVSQTDYVCDLCKIGILTNPIINTPPQTGYNYVCPNCQQTSVLDVAYPQITYSS